MLVQPMSANVRNAVSLNVSTAINFLSASGVIMKKYEKFEDWFEEMEITADRSDRFYDEMKYMTYQRAVEWLRAAWDCARAEACEYCSQPELAEVFFDQKCPGCVDRMSKFADTVK